jgi:hypothetical protein
LPDLPYLLWLITTPNVIWSTVFWTVATALAYRPLVRRFGLAPLPTALALASLAVIAVITLTPPATADPPHGCLAVSRTELLEAFTHFGAGIQEKLNILMLVPLGFFLTLATGRPGRCAVAVAVLPAVIEFVQGSFAGRYCSPLDWSDNAAGGLAGVGAAAAWAAFARRRAGRSGTAAGPPGQA